jgi:hypothetical protein
MPPLFEPPKHREKTLGDNPSECSWELKDIVYGEKVKMPSNVACARSPDREVLHLLQQMLMNH